MLKRITSGLVLVALIACAEDATDGRTGRNARAGDDDILLFETDETDETDAVCEPENLTQACRCDGGVPGRQVCSDALTWDACECALTPTLVVDDSAANKLTATFNWKRTDPVDRGEACKPGHYDGKLDGLYNAPSASNTPVPIVSVDATGAAGLQLDLVQGGNGEFLTVTGGHFNGVALAIFPFKADFADGMLDCTTGLFRARLVNGSYEVFFEGFYGGKVTYQFEGDIVARYDPQTDSLVDGRWSVSEGAVMPPAISPDEPPPTFPTAQAGGTGTWSAKWTR
jgi:hypothetical protein